MIAVDQENTLMRCEAYTLKASMAMYHEPLMMMIAFIITLGEIM